MQLAPTPARRMVSARSPLRVTLGGGGTDLASYYRHRGGFIFAMAINRAIDIHCHRPEFDARVTVNGVAADGTEALQHELTRAALQRHGIADRFELASLADIAGGTGLGSSSCFLVTLLHALHALAGRDPGPAALAEEACSIEIDALGKGIGKQDQYMAAYGGLTTLEVAPDGRVTVERVVLAPELEAEFVRRTHIYYTGLRRDAATVLSEQNHAMAGEAGEAHARVQDSLDFIRDLGHRILGAWRRGDLDGWGRMLDEHWQQKKRLSRRITWPAIDALYDTARREFGVLGGKVIGAGGGGFLMLFCPGRGEALEEYMRGQGLPRLEYRIDPRGSRILPFEACPPARST